MIATLEERARRIPGARAGAGGLPGGARRERAPAAGAEPRAAPGRREAEAPRRGEGSARRAVPEPRQPDLRGEGREAGAAERGEPRFAAEAPGRAPAGVPGAGRGDLRQGIQAALLAAERDPEAGRGQCPHERGYAEPHQRAQGGLQDPGRLGRGGARAGAGSLGAAARAGVRPSGELRGRRGRQGAARRHHPAAGEQARGGGLQGIPTAYEAYTRAEDELSGSASSAATSNPCAPT